MARTPVMSGLEELAGTGVRSTRREALRAAAGAGLAWSAFGALGCGSSSSIDATGVVRGSRVVIIGAGLAGLCCAHRLRQAGIRADVYEANERLGGRCWTIREVFAEGQIAEHGGEFIDTDHAAIRRLVNELGLHLDDVNAAEKNGTVEGFYIDGAPYSNRDALADLERIRPAVKRDLHAAGYPTLYNEHTPAGESLDHISILDWVEANVPGGTGSRLGKLIDVAYTIEFGGESSDQSALNLIYLLGYARPHRLQLFGASNERFHVHGGNDLIVSRLADQLGAQITTGAKLSAIRADGSGYRLSFDGAPEQHAEVVVLAIPFAVMRDSVDYSDAGFSARKRTAIQEQGMGTNAKLQLQFSSRPWLGLGSDGATYADTGYQSTWEVTRAQPGRAGILVDYTGGRIGDGFGDVSKQLYAKRFLHQLEPVLPGVGDFYNGRVALDYWAGNPLSNGSYAYYRVGQLTKFSGVEKEPSGNCHFAGEHTSITFQGYLEGAVRSGERAANEVAAAV